VIQVIYQHVEKDFQLEFFINSLGPRWCLIGGMTWQQLKMLGEWILLEINVDKNHRKLGDRTTVRIHQSMLIKPIPARLLNRPKNGQERITTKTYAQYMAALARAAKASQQTRPTTYTMRRNFIQRVIEACTTQHTVNGRTTRQIDEARVKSLTAHLDFKMVRSTYEQHARDL
jgi:hypothetical protein